MSIIKYLQETLFNEILVTESQKEAKQLAQSEKNPNFGMYEFDTLKTVLKEPKLYKYMGWIARNWDTLSHEGESLHDLVHTYDKYINTSGTILKPMAAYKTNPEEWIRDIK